MSNLNNNMFEEYKTYQNLNNFSENTSMDVENE